MKYLGIGKLIWFTICLVCTTLEGLVYILYNTLYFLWSFKFFKWKWLFSRSSRFDNTWDGTRYVDHTPIDTFKRHYRMFDNINNN